MTAPRTDGVENPPAFPQHPHIKHQLEEGMSLRDWFAGQALAGLISGLGSEELQPAGAGIVASEAYMLAHAMLRARAALAVQS